MKTVRRFVFSPLLWVLRLGWGALRWLGLMLLLLIGTTLLSFFLSPLLEVAAAGSWQRAALDTLARLLTAIPFVAIFVLLLHPIRGRAILARAIRAALRRVFRWGSASDATPSASPAQAEPGHDPAPPQPLQRQLSRRRLLVEGVAVGAILTNALFVEPRSIDVLEVELPVRDLPERFYGFRMVQISDLHISPYTTVEDLARAVARINTLGPDVVLVTGDFVDIDRRYAPATMRALRALTPREGIYTVLGNHDYYADPNEAYAVASELRRHDLGLLRNSGTVLRRGADKLYLLGSDDPTDQRGGGAGRRADLAGTLRSSAADAPRILLIHNPILAPAIDESGVDVAICGHTHGGQFRIPYLTSAIVKSVEYIDHGRYQFRPGGAQFYVNRGFGTAGPPMRFRARPEITLLRLVPA